MRRTLAHFMSLYSRQSYHWLHKLGGEFASYVLELSLLANGAKPVLDEDAQF
jgi:hypothetical protein